MSFPEQPFGFVAGRWVLSIGDTPDDPDRAPDYVPVKDAVVVFTPQVTHRVAADGSGWAGIIKDRVLGGVGERGQLIDAEGHDHLALAVGVYSVSYDFGLGGSWPSHYIEVKPEHTADAPLWLPPIAPPPEGPRIENRVVTIPADGEDGQVLVWDGAGFSWADVPEGPQGPAGEVTTAALTSALAGKVTGEGMSVRHDTSVGERVFLDHPGGTTMLYGDTGWRNIPVPTDIPGAEPGGDAPVQIRRVGDVVNVVIDRISFTADYVSGTLKIPVGSGFTPIIPYLPFAGYPNGNARSWTWTGNVLNAYSGAVYKDARWNWTFTTSQPWPSVLPGEPA